MHAIPFLLQLPIAEPFAQVYMRTQPQREIFLPSKQQILPRILSFLGSMPRVLGQYSHESTSYVLAECLAKVDLAILLTGLRVLGLLRGGCNIC
jgi:hypothetical protein